MEDGLFSGWVAHFSVCLAEICLAHGLSTCLVGDLSSCGPSGWGLRICLPEVFLRVLPSWHSVCLEFTFPAIYLGDSSGHLATD